MSSPHACNETEIAWHCQRAEQEMQGSSILSFQLFVSVVYVSFVASLTIPRESVAGKKYNQRSQTVWLFLCNIQNIHNHFFFHTPPAPEAMGQGQSTGGGQHGRGGDENKKERRKYEPPAPPTRVGKKQKKRKKGLETGSRLPNVTPVSKCKLRKLKLERLKDWLLLEEEYVTNQERLKPQEERNEEDRTKVRVQKASVNDFR